APSPVVTRSSGRRDRRRYEIASNATRPASDARGQLCYPLDFGLRTIPAVEGPARADLFPAIIPQSGSTPGGGNRRELYRRDSPHTPGLRRRVGQAAKTLRRAERRILLEAGAIPSSLPRSADW